MKRKVNILLCAAAMLFSAVNVFPEIEEIDHIMMADIPFTYGQAGFIERIEKRAGEREPVGLVLSGGSARAFAHIGVLKRMEELGVVPDFIVANSMGSIVGLLYGAGFSPDQISEIIQSTNIGELFRLTFPLGGGIIDVGKFSGVLHSYVGELNLEDLYIPVMVLCEDLRTKRQVRIAEGNLLEVMQAAYALPLYFNPVEYSSHLLIDGGISNLVPLDTAYQYTSTVIAVSAFYQNPKLNLRNPVTNINVALDIGKSRTGIIQIKKFKPLLIRCDVESFSFMEFDRLAEIQEAGYRSASDMGERLRRIVSGGVGDDLVSIRAEKQGIINRAKIRYRPLNSIPVLSPSVLPFTEIKFFTRPDSGYYLSNDIHLTTGLGFSAGYFNTGISAGLGADLALEDPFFPVLNANALFDPFYFLRLKTEFTYRFDSSYAAASLHYIPVSGNHFRSDFLVSGEMDFSSVFEPGDYLLTMTAALAGETAPGSPGTISAALKLGGQLDSSADVAGLADLSIRLPVPGTAGLVLWKNRGFIRFPVIGGNVVRYYLNDSMRSSIPESTYGSLMFAGAELVFNPYDFRPAFAELVIIKDIEAGIFGEAGLFDQFVWSSGVSLSLSASLIGLTPLNLSGFIGYDSLKNGIFGGFTIGG